MDGFTKLNDITSIYRPAESSNSTDKSTLTAPSLIVLCSWMGAATKHILKYTDGYKRLFQNANILLIESTLANMFIGSDLAPASEILDSFVQEAASENTDHGRQLIILHAMSNGGANNATWLAERFLKTHSRLPFDRMILDCCPGRPEVTSATRAITLSLPSQYLVRLIGSYLIYLGLLLSKLINETFGLENTIIRIRRQLNDPAIFPTATPRLYLYSEGDAMVDFRDVHDHAQEAKQSGCLVVQEEKFLKAPHCGLPIESSERYWDAVRTHVLNSNDMHECN